MMISNELYHFGVKGMHWGVRKKYDKIGRSHNKNQNDEITKNRHRLSDKTKRNIKIGATVAGTCLLAYGGYRLYKNGVFDSTIKFGK